MALSTLSLRFGPFRWDALNRLLLRDGIEIPLPPRVLALLECLVERPGQVISRQELIERVWRDAFVTDTSLAEAMSFLRQALGDDPQTPRYVQTIHRRGYRFVAPVEPEPPAKGDTASTSPHSADEAPTSRPSIGGALIPWSLVVLLGATLVVALWRLTHPSVAAQPRVTRFEFRAPEGVTLRGDRNNLAISPDGRLIAFAGCRDYGCRLFMRDLHDLAARALEDTAGAAAPFFSPDGRFVGFFAEGKLKRTSITGGAPVVLADAPEALGAAWLDDGRIVFAAHESGGLDAVSENGGAPGPLTLVDARAGELGHRWPRWIAGTDYVIFTAVTALSDRETDRAMARSLSTNRTHVVTGRATGAMLMSPNILIFGRGAELEAARFDPVSGTLAGVPVTVAQEVRSGDDGMPVFVSSAQGTLLHLPGRATDPQRDLVSTAGTRPIARSLARLREPAMDRQGLRIAGIISDGLRGDLWIGETARGTMTRLTNAYPAAAPVWSPDGQQVVFSAAVDGPFNLWVADPEGPSTRRLLTSGANQFATDVTIRGQVLFTQIDPSTRGDIWMRGPDGRPTPLVQTGFDERDGLMSPDERWLAYRSDESGRWQVYVKDLRGGNRFVVSQADAGRPWWLDDGRLVYETANGALVGMRMTDQGPDGVGTPLEFTGRAVVSVARSGAVLVSPRPSPPASPIVTIEAWQDIWRVLPPAVANLPR